MGQPMRNVRPTSKGRVGGATCLDLSAEKPPKSVYASKSYESSFGGKTLGFKETESGGVEIG